MIPLTQPLPSLMSSVVDHVAQSRVLSVSWPDIVAALPKPGVGRQEVKRGRQIIKVFFGLFVTPLGKRIQPHGFHIVSRFRREPVLRFMHV